jgi:hypothetical protein
VGALVSGRVTPETLRASVKAAVTAVHKMHPDRGTPASLDAQIFDDGPTTLGERISNDVFRF